MVRLSLGDEGPYQSLVVSLGNLCDSFRFKSIPSQHRLRAKELKSFLKQVFERAKNYARSRFPGLAQLIYTEVAGHRRVVVGVLRLSAGVVAPGKTRQV